MTPHSRGVLADPPRRRVLSGTDRRVLIPLAAVISAVLAGLGWGADREHPAAPSADLYAEYAALPWPCGPGVREWTAPPADPHGALAGQWLSDDEIRATLGRVVPEGGGGWTADRLEGLRLWAGALRGAFHWVHDTYAPVLAERPLSPAEDGERSKTLADSTERFFRALTLTATEISTGKAADWGDMERPTTRLCEGIYTGR